MHWSWPRGSASKWTARTDAEDVAAHFAVSEPPQMVTFYQFPRGNWRHVRTTNVIKSPFAAMRLRTDTAKRFKRVANATAVGMEVSLVAERTFRRINSPELLPSVAAEQRYHDGRPIRGGQHQEADA